MNGLVTEIKRLAVHDGNGIRTTVFLKGCPLRCAWCHNPESIEPKPVIRYIDSRCMHCGLCREFCPNHCVTGSEHYLNRNSCTACGRCVPKCPNGALVLCGRSMSAEQVVAEALEDRAFYEISGGGVTLSGGEPLLQPAFCAEILSELKKEGIHTAVDTCGYASRQVIESIIDTTDLFLYDIKAFDEEIHISCTGKSNRIILDNFRFLVSSGKQVEVRFPFVPGYNDSQVRPIGSFLADVGFQGKLRVLQYHAFAQSKYQSLNMQYTAASVPVPDRQTVDEAVSILKSFSIDACNGYE